MKYKIFASLFFLFLALRSESQEYKFVYYLDKDLNSVTKQKADIIGKAYEQDGHLLLNCFLKTTGKMIITAGVKDSALSALHGIFRTYYEDMKIESEGNYTENDMEGVWKYWNTDGHLTDSMIYRQGIRVAYAAYKYSFSKPTFKQLFLNPRLKDTLIWYRYSFTDSLKNTFTEKEVSIKNEKEKTDFEVFFAGERGLLKVYDSTGAVKTDSVFERQLVDPEFLGGEDGWRNFLRKTLNAGVPADNNAPDGKYTVIIRFFVNPDGTLADIKAENDPGYGMAEEAKRVLKMSAKWLPAIRYGTYQRAYRRQPITFVIEGMGK